MAAPRSPVARSHLGNFRKAALFLDDGQYLQAIIRAKSHLTNLLLPTYWQLKNCVIVVLAEDDWDEVRRFLDISEELLLSAPDDQLFAPLRADIHTLKGHHESERERVRRETMQKRSNQGYSPTPRVASSTGPPLPMSSTADKDGVRLEVDDQEAEEEEDEEEEEEQEAEEEQDDSYEAGWIANAARRDRAMEPDAIAAIRKTMKPNRIRETMVGQMGKLGVADGPNSTDTSGAEPNRKAEHQKFVEKPGAVDTQAVKPDQAKSWWTAIADRIKYMDPRFMH